MLLLRYVFNCIANKKEFVIGEKKFNPKGFKGFVTLEYMENKETILQGKHDSY